MTSLVSHAVSRCKVPELRSALVVPRRHLILCAKPRAKRHSFHLRAGPADVYVFDFDGVLVDSEPEVSHSALRAARHFWPKAFDGISEEGLKAVEEGMEAVRPVLVHGYEAMIMARLLAEDKAWVEPILESWPTLWPAQLEAWGVAPAILSGFFDGYRSGCFTVDRARWVSLNKPYPGVVESLEAFDAPFYIASSKSERRLRPLLKELFRLDFPESSPRLFASLIPPSQRKIETLLEVKGRPLVQEAGARLHFVDDRWETLKAVAEHPELQDVRLYFAFWGYSTPEEKKEASQSKRIRTIGLHQFTELLKWGILMGVDDGCEPEMEEVLAGVTEPKSP